MTAEDLASMFDYAYWANRKLFEAVSGLSTERFTQDVAGSYGSIRNTLVHMMSTEWGWMERSGGTKRGPKLNGADFPTFSSVHEKWTWVESQIRAFLNGLSDDDLNREVEFSLGDGPEHVLSIGQMMHHAAVHSVHHRGQVALLLRQLGVAPGNFDIVFYYAESPRRQIHAG